MNKIIITGNLVRDPESGTTPNGVNYCRFTVAVRKRFHKDGEEDCSFIRVTAWRGLGDTCRKNLAKGRKVGIIGEASVSAYTGRDGQARASMEISADEVEFLSPRPAEQTDQGEAPQQPAGMTPVQVDDLPF